MKEPSSPLGTPWTVPFGLTLVYLALLFLTRPHFMGDTIDYAIEVPNFNRRAWEFGHLWWVPLGWVLHTLLGIEDRVSIVRVFLAVNWVAGLACVLLLNGLLRRLGIRRWTALAVTVTFLFAQAFLDYTQTGSSYVPGLAFVLAALYLVVPREDEASPLARSLGAGACLGAAICFWFPYVLVVPGVVLAPVLLSGFHRSRLWFSVRVALALGVVVVAAYGVAVISLGIVDVAGFRTWMAQASHGVRTGGVARMVFGLARSFLFMGDDGVAFKRFLLHDPYNPVTLVDLFRLSLWKVALFYLALLTVPLSLLGSAPGRRLLLLALVGAVPVIGFGVFWQGGDMERYLPLYPFLFLALAGALDEQGTWKGAKVVLLTFCGLVVVVNGLALSAWEVGRYQRSLVERVEELRGRLTPGSQVLVVRDKLKLLPRDFPLDPASRQLPIVEVAVPGLAETGRWRQDVAELVTRTWQNEGDVWLSRRLCAERPHPNSIWVEGDDPRLTWQDIAAFFTKMETSDQVGGEDGFVRLVDSPHNRRLLADASTSAP